MDSQKCHHCGSDFSARSLKRVDDKLKKNSLIFKETFMKLHIMNPKFCKRCKNIWLKLEDIRGKSNISKFISDRESEMNKKDEGIVTFVTDDDPLAIPSSSSSQKSISNNDQSLPRRVTRSFSNSQGYISTLKNYSKQINVEEQIDDNMNQKDSNPVQSDTVLQEDEPVDDIIQPGPSLPKQDMMNETSDNNRKDEGKDYDYWKRLVQKTWSSNDVGAKFRYEFKYYNTKMKEAEQNGFAKEDVKDYDYWSKLFNQIFRSDKSGTEVTEDLRYFLGKMKETHLCEK